MKRAWLFHLLLILIALSAGFLVAFSTRVGPGVGGDATVYIVAARNLVNGDGLGWMEPDGRFRLLADFPPGYPLLLAVAGGLGAEWIPAARWINVILFSCFVWLAGYLVYRAARAPVFALLGAALMGTSPVLIPVYSWAMSEPLFLFCGFLGLFFLWLNHTRPSWIWLLLSALAAGFAFLTRYSGLAFLITGGVLLLVWKDGSLRSHLRDSMLYVFAAGAPMVFWFVVSYFSTGMIASRRWGTGEPLYAALKDFWVSFSNALLFWVMPDSWVVGERFPRLVFQIVPVLIVLFLVGWILLIWLRSKKVESLHVGEANGLLVVLAVFSLVYISVILAIRLAVFPIIAINIRMLSPLYAAVLIMVILLATLTVRFWLHSAQPLYRWSPALLLALGLLWYTWISAHVVNQLSKDGLGYTSRSWQNSELIAAVEELPQDALLVTNEPKALLLLTGRVPYALEEVYLRDPLEGFTRFGEGDIQEDEGQQVFRQQEAALILFDSIESQLQRLYLDRTRERITSLTEGLFLFFEGNDGAIFFYEETP